MQTGARAGRAWCQGSGSWRGSNGLHGIAGREAGQLAAPQQPLPQHLPKKPPCHASRLPGSSRQAGRRQLRSNGAASGAAAAVRLTQAAAVGQQAEQQSGRQPPHHHEGEGGAQELDVHPRRGSHLRTASAPRGWTVAPRAAGSKPSRRRRRGGMQPGGGEGHSMQGRLQAGHPATLGPWRQPHAAQDSASAVAAVCHVPQARRLRTRMPAPKSSIHRKSGARLRKLPSSSDLEYLTRKNMWKKKSRPAGGGAGVARQAWAADVD